MKETILLKKLFKLLIFFFQCPYLQFIDLEQNIQLLDVKNTGASCAIYLLIVLVLKKREQH